MCSTIKCCDRDESKGFCVFCSLLHLWGNIGRSINVTFSSIKLLTFCLLHSSQWQKLSPWCSGFQFPQCSLVITFLQGLLKIDTALIDLLLWNKCNHHDAMVTICVDLLRSRNWGEELFFAVDISLTWFCMSKVKVINYHLKVKIILRSFLSVWLSISKQEVDLRLKGILVNIRMAEKLTR